MKWHGGLATEITVKSLSGAPLTLAYGEKTITMDTDMGTAYRFNSDLEWIK